MTGLLRTLARFAHLCAALLVGAPGSQAVAANWTGVVTHVSDGDTLWVRLNDGQAPRKIRLEGIDAPEICQRHGGDAAQALARRVLHRPVRLATRATDDYQRTLARVSVKGEDVGAWMVAQGHAWSYRYRKNPGPYAKEEAAARRLKRGLFADERPLRPREFRQRHGSCHSGGA
jgi:endonuclease YncB( thermonuclease family)